MTDLKTNLIGAFHFTVNEQDIFDTHPDKGVAEMARAFVQVGLQMGEGRYDLARTYMDKVRSDMISTADRYHQMSGVSEAKDKRITDLQEFAGKRAEAIDVLERQLGEAQDALEAIVKALAPVTLATVTSLGDDTAQQGFIDAYRLACEISRK